MIDNLQHNILTDLPAWEAHKKMAPPMRTAQVHIPNDVRYSAVCILMYLKNNDPHTILIKRTADGTHGGQISFPGGRLDENDFSFTYCALRECEEEIGLAKSKIKVLGTLSSLYIPPSNFLVQPILCTSTEVSNLIPSENEVAEIIEVSLKKLFRAENKITQEVWSSGTGVRMQAPSYQVEQHTIWGATAMMLAELEDVVLRSS